MRTRFAIAVAMGLAAALIASTALALPEYATKTGEPCGTCHNSAAGGGLRTPRGQAWVAGERPVAVPMLDESLATLGVRLTGDPADYLAPSAPPPALKPLATRWEWKMRLIEILLDYGGN